MARELISAGVAGLLSSGLFLVVFGAGLGFLFMFLPTLPLFFLGLSTSARHTHAATGVATLLIGLIAGPASAVLYLVFLGLPTWYFSRKAMAILPAAGNSKEWYPVGLIILNLALYASGVVMLMTLYYIGQPGGLPQILAQNIREAFSDLEGDYSDIIEQLATGWSFMMFPLTIWLWGIILFAHAWLANRILVRQSKQSRPDMEVKPFAMPSWMLTLLAIAGLASIIGSPSMAFLGKSSLLTLMLPYFFLGCAQMHQSTQSWPSCRFFMFFVYFMVFTQFWPALLLAGFGLWHQLRGFSHKPV